METLPLSFAVLLNYLSVAVQQIADPRQSSNATRYKLGDVILGAFSVFFMQCESFLEHQRQMQSRRGKDNAQSLFGIAEIPSSTQIRNLLDAVAAVGLFEVFIPGLCRFDARWTLAALSAMEWTSFSGVGWDGVLQVAEDSL